MLMYLFLAFFFSLFVMAFTLKEGLEKTTEEIRELRKDKEASQKCPVCRDALRSLLTARKSIKNRDVAYPGDSVIAFIDSTVDNFPPSVISEVRHELEEKDSLKNE